MSGALESLVELNRTSALKCRGQIGGLSNDEDLKFGAVNACTRNLCRALDVTRFLLVQDSGLSSSTGGVTIFLGP